MGRASECYFGRKVGFLQTYLAPGVGILPIQKSFPGVGVSMLTLGTDGCITSRQHGIINSYVKRTVDGQDVGARFHFTYHNGASVMVILKCQNFF